MTDSVDALLGGEEDISDYDLRDEDEDALLEDDDTSNEIRADDSVDILDLNSTDDDYGLNAGEDEEESGQRDKFTSERVESSATKDIMPDTTTQPNKTDIKQNNVDNRTNNFNNNRGRFPRRNMRGGTFRGRGRGGNQRVYKNVQNRSFQYYKPRPEGNKCFLNPKFLGNVHLQPGGGNLKRPPMLMQPWDNHQHFQQQQQPPNYQIQIDQPVRHPTPFQNPPFQQFHAPPPIPQIQVQVKQPVHQRLGVNNPQQFIQSPPQQQQQQQQPYMEYNQSPMYQQPPPNYQQQFNQPMNFNPPSPIYNPPPVNNCPSYQPSQPQWQPPPPPQPIWQPPMEPPHHNIYEAPPHIEDNYNNVPMNQNFPPPLMQPNYNQYEQYPQQQDCPIQQYQPHNQMDNSNNYRHRNERPHNNMVINRKFVVKNYSPNKRKIDHRVHEEPMKRRSFENKNLQEVQTVDTTTPQIKVSVAPAIEEDEETKKYREKIERQKDLRERLLAQKEERRRLAAMKKQAEEELQNVISPAELIKTVPVIHANIKPAIVPKILSNQPIIVQANTFVRNIVGNENKVEQEQIKSFLSNRKIIAKDQSLVDTSVVVVSNLAAGTTEIKLRKLCHGVGDIKNFDMSPKERQATIDFKSVASAHAFYKKYQRFMLDLSMIQVTLKQ